MMSIVNYSSLYLLCLLRYKKADYSSPANLLVKHTEFNIQNFVFVEVLPHCDIRCTIEEVFLGKTKESLDAVKSELTITSVFGCITIAVSY